MRARGQCGGVELEIALQREAAHADRGAPEAVGVAGAGRPLAEREGHSQAVDLVCGGEHAAGLGLRERAAGRTGKVLLVHRGADRLREACEPRILGADVPLEIGELADELGSLVGLGEPGRLAGGIAASERIDEGLPAARPCRRSFRHPPRT